MSNLHILITRDSVCAGDDGDAPHEIRMNFGAISLREAVSQIVAARYLASITGGCATWVLVGRVPLAVLAQQWSEPEFLVDPDGPLEDHLADPPKLHFRYLAQKEPQEVLASERAAAGSSPV